MELIVAFAKNGVIGNNNQIPWYIPEDLIRFKHMTQNNVIIMGRRTFESFPNGPLQDRIHIVLTRVPCENNSAKYPGVYFVNMENLLETIEPYVKTESKKIFVIGGKEIYDLLLDCCKIVHITLVDMEPKGDTRFSHDINFFLEKYTLIYKSDAYICATNQTKYVYYTFHQK
jgi:dihydrofolate reductase